LVLWGDMLVDGHNRYGICRKHGLPFQATAAPQQEATGSSEGSVESLQQRVAALTEENAALRRQVALLQEHLLARAHGVDQTADASAPF
jgi:hypothetical protein